MLPRPGKPVAQYVDKRQEALVQCRIHCTSWTDTDDIKRYRVEIIADEIAFLARDRGTGRSDVGEDDIFY